MARRKIEVSSEGVKYSEGLPTLQDIVNTVSESEYRDAIANPGDVIAHWNKYKVEHGAGSGLTMISDLDPTSKASNLKIAKNATHPHPLVRGTWQMGMALQQANKSGIVETCGNCRTPQCTAICNADSGHMAIKGGTADVAKQVRTQYWVDHPQMAGALAVIQARQGSAAARMIGKIPALRTNMWSDVDWTETNLRGPLIEDFEEIAGPKRAEGLAADFPLLTHSNYSKKTMNRALRPGESEPDVNYPSNYIVTGSISEQTPIERIKQRFESGRGMHGVFWATPSQEKPNTVTIVDRNSNRADFPMYNADNMDAIMHNRAIGNVGIGGLRHKQTEGLREQKGTMDVSSMVRPLDPDAPVGHPMGIPKAYASPEAIERLGLYTRPSRRKAFKGE